ncbi:syntaxin-17 [Drosophila grimshawi]|uniref:GH15679 n=1 Tax=Drosophila grimshawi TaxID=7222 RepID=B4IZP0_DROGR|nr:syntaxin-17 [Drosophila grimshawi]EDV95625.1 GH15679 [Drosophila grimshawi]
MTNDKLPLKQAAVSVQRFQDEAVPHHLSLLQNHRSNIEKSLALGDWQKIKKEELNAMRVIKQMKNLLLEMDALREKLRDEDLERFDDLMKPGKDKAFEGMKRFAELKLKSPSSRSSRYDDQDEDQDQVVSIVNVPALQHALPQLETDFQLEQHQLAQREACLVQMEQLQHEIQDLHGMFHGMRQLTQEQATSVQSIADNAEEALENVQQGERSLRNALGYKKAMYPVVGALLGTCVGGPIGLVAGIKAGGLAAVGCGILGFTGGSVLKSNPDVLHGNIEEQRGQQEGNNDNDSMETLELADKSHE